MLSTNNKFLLIDRYFENLEAAQTNEQALGGHAFLAVGYDDSKKRFIIRNSFTLPYPYLDDRDLSGDFWTIRRGESLCKFSIRVQIHIVRDNAPHISVRPHFFEAVPGFSSPLSGSTLLKVPSIYEGSTKYGGYFHRLNLFTVLSYS